MLEIIRQFVPQMTHGEKLDLMEALKAAIAREIAAEGGPEAGACPRCGCGGAVRKGRDRKGRQRWLCRGCGRTFSSATSSVLAMSKLPPETWMAYAECMADALTLRESAGRCGVCLRTSWFMRHRLCEVMASLLEPFRCGTECHVDSTYVPESLAGNHARSASFSMPRKARRFGREGVGRGISNQLVCVMCGASDLGDASAVVCCRGRESSAEAGAALAGRVDGAPLVATDMHGSYPAALTALGVRSHRRVDPRDRSAGNIAMVDSLHSRLDAFLARFRGVATRHLQHYLDWFCYAEQFKKGGADRRELLFRHASAGTYRTTRRGYVDLLRPFMDYWGVSTVV